MYILSPLLADHGTLYTTNFIALLRLSSYVLYLPWLLLFLSFSEHTVCMLCPSIFAHDAHQHSNRYGSVSGKIRHSSAAERQH